MYIYLLFFYRNKGYKRGTTDYGMKKIEKEKEITNQPQSAAQ